MAFRNRSESTKASGRRELNGRKFAEKMANLSGHVLLLGEGEDHPGVSIEWWREDDGLAKASDGDLAATKLTPDGRQLSLLRLADILIWTPEREKELDVSPA
ncbi:hypothetical protein [Arthrobacter sp. KNU40]|uniref:hypothetical protein n=1 Tax=Arthrobacter sp. KNU40 TaxID=3447965 RepID=UPI003F62EEC5